MVQARRTVMAAGLPLDPIDSRVPPVVRDSPRDQAMGFLDVCSADISVGDKVSSASERHEPQRAKVGNRNALGVSASVRNCSSYAVSRSAIRSMPDTVAAPNGSPEDPVSRRT
jgi:hypothetical protein